MGKAAQKRFTRAIRESFQQAKLEAKYTKANWYEMWLYPLTKEEKDYIGAVDDAVRDYSIRNPYVVKTREGYVASTTYQGQALFCRDKDKAKRLPFDYALCVVEMLSYLEAEVEKA